MRQAAPNVEEIFFAALELQGSEARSAFLDRACGDAELRRRVERLLAHDAQTSDFLETPASTPTMTMAPDSRPGVEEPGTIVGPYKLLEAIGEGGMGTVYLAEQQEPVRRRVALKVIKHGMDTKQVVARFEAERQALAMMDHPNIAKVHDAGGTPEGRPYFVMELVRGLPITEYCDREQVPITERLELFTLVCRAVQHAHQKGVIHRDLKPSNILVTVIDGVAVPKVIDFGVAKATGGQLTDKTLFTGFHQFIGTPLYVSPEQADLAGVDVDTRSDIYSLGVLLYELLTGTTPFDSETLKRAAFDEMRRMIREDQPQKPSTRLGSLGERLSTISASRKADPKRLGPSMKGELDWVVMKALEKDRGRRYETANDFAADVMRYLTDRPVEAYPPSAWYRFGKFTKRHRVALATTGLVVASLVAGTVVSTWHAAIADRARRQAVAALKDSEVQRREARRAVDAMYTRVAEQWLADQPGMKPLQREFLLEALRYYKSFAGRRDTTAEERAEVATAFDRVGRIQSELGQSDDALAAYGRAASLLGQLVAERPRSAEYRLFLAGTLDGHGSLAWRLGDLANAERLTREAIEYRRWLVEHHPAVVEYASLLAESQGHLGLVLKDAGHRDEAREQFRQAADRLRGLLGERGGDPKLEGRLSDLANNNALLLQEAGQLGEAERALRESLSRLESVVESSPDRPDYRLNLAYRYVNLASLLLRTARPADAEAEFRRAVGPLERLSREFADVPEYRNTLAKAHAGLGAALRTQGKQKEGEASLTTSLTLRESLVRDFPDRVEFRRGLVQDLNNRGVNYVRSQRLADAEAMFRRAVAEGEALVAGSPGVAAYRDDLVAYLNSLSLVLNKLGRDGEAEQILWRAVSLAEKSGKPAHLATACSSLGMVLHALGRPDDAASSYLRSRAIWGQVLSVSENPSEARHSLAGVLHNLANVHAEKGELAEARDLFGEAISHQRAALKATPRNLPFRLFLRNHYRGLAEVLARLGEHEELERHIAEMRKEFPSDGQVAAFAAKSIIDVLRPVEQERGTTPERRRELTDSYAALVRQLIEQSARLSADDPVALALLARVLADASEVRFRDPARAADLARMELSA